MAVWKGRQQMGWAALIMGASILISRFMGLIRDKTISYFFGATQESDIYFAAFVIPDFINYLLAGAYFSITLIPLLATHFDRSEEDGWRFFSAVFNWIGLLIVVFTVVAVAFAQPLAHLAAPGLQEQDLARLAFFLRIVFPAQIFFLLGSCLTAILYLRKQFIVPALSPLVYNLLIILGGILLRSRGMEGFCWGVLAGAFVGNFLLPFLAVRRKGDLRISFSFAHPGLKRFVILALPLMLGQSIVVMDEQLVRVFGSMAGTGAISWLSYARRIMLVPVGVVAQAAGVASFPFMAELVARKDFPRFHQTLNRALRGVLTLLVPLSVWMMIVAEPTITLIFQQGHFNPSDTQHTAQLLQILLATVFCWGFQQILGRGFYACQDTLTPAILGTLVTVASLPGFFLLTRHLQAAGVALASAASIALYTGTLALWWRRRFGGETFAGLGKDLLKTLGVSIFASGPALLIARLGFPGLDFHSWPHALYAISASGLGFGIVFVLLSCYFAPSTVRPFLERMGPVGSRLIR